MTHDIRICFLGDSLVNGTGDDTALGWAGRLCAKARAGGALLTYYNLGIRGNTSKDILARWQNECALRVPAGIDGRIVLSCGVNDTVMQGRATRLTIDESCASVREILTHAAAKYKTIMVGPPPVHDDTQNRRIKMISEMFARESQTLGVPFIEIFSHLVGDMWYRKEISDSDGAHPRSGGYATIMQLIDESASWWFSS